MSNLPPGVRQSDLDGPRCTQHNALGCDCEPDSLTYAERCEEDKGEARMERERAE